MIVYFGETVTVQAAGRAWRAEQCEHCGKRFYYPVEMIATGSAENPYFLDSTSGERAEQRARGALEEALRHQVVPVPCPHCSLYQNYMLPAAVPDLLPRLRRAASLLLGLTPVALFIGFPAAGAIGYPAGAAVFVIPVLLLCAGIWASVKLARGVARYDPNAPNLTDDRRRMAGWWGALVPEAFERLGGAAVPVVQPRGRSGQLVNQNCTRCGLRIPDELDSRFCVTCGSPVHNRCATPAEGGCPACGAALNRP